MTNRTTLVLVAALALSRTVHASSLCVRRNGSGVPSEGATVKLRTTCASNEIALDPASVAFTVPPVVTVRTGSPISTTGTVSTPAPCAAGEVATGGGALSIGSGGGSPVIRSSRPEPETAGAVPTSWRVTVANEGAAGSITVTPYAVCLVQ
jgi:hypothetical protein